MQQQVQAFLAGQTFAVAGASRDRAKFGNKVLRCYQRHDRIVYPLNPQASEVEGLPAYKSVADLPEPVHGLSIVTPPRVTEQIVAAAIEAGICHVWMQPGAESAAAVDACNAAGINVVAGGPCLLVELG